jgi:hypothetical protein
MANPNTTQDPRWVHRQALQIAGMLADDTDRQSVVAGEMSRFICTINGVPLPFH